MAVTVKDVSLISVSTGARAEASSSSACRSARQCWHMVRSSGGPSGALAWRLLLVGCVFGI